MPEFGNTMVPGNIMQVHRKSQIEPHRHAFSPRPRLLYYYDVSKSDFYIFIGFHLVPIPILVGAGGAAAATAANAAVT